MLIGLFLRAYKNYNGLNYIHLTNDLNNKFTVFSGANGAGKSAILEVLDYYFNIERDWNLLKNGKRDEALVAPIFLLEKSKYKQKMLIEIGNVLWKFSKKDTNNIAALQEFLHYKEELKKNIDYTKYFLVCLPYLPYEKDLGETKIDSPFGVGTLNNFFTTEFPDINIKQYIEKLRQEIWDSYAYIYFPVETSVSEATKLYSTKMQYLMGKDIVSEIDSVLDNKIIDGKDSIVSFINKKLLDFIKNINKSMSEIDDQYSYKTSQGVAQKLSTKIIREKIIDTYFSTISLKKTTKDLDILSSGEQRTALIDVAYAFLAQDDKPEYEVIFALDEPEASLNTAACFEQFLRVSNLANTYHYQTLITTHWYGFIPLAESGTWCHIDKEEDKISVFDLSLAFDNRGTMPDDIEIKSYFDLVTSILSLSRTKKTNWLICEGADDAQYLKTFFEIKKRTDIIILPVGGSGNVIKLFNYLSIPVQEKSEQKALNGTIVCLIDSDKQRVNFEGNSSIGNDKKKKLYIRRLQINGDVTDLLSLEKSGLYDQTEMEDCLDAKVYFDAVNKYIEYKNDPELKEIIKYFQYNEKSKYANVSKDLAFLKLLKVEGQDEKQKVYDYIMENLETKNEIAKIYSELSNNSNIPDWIDTLLNLYK
ncbi:MAG: AAA family ATPase [Sulfuricurvum sp.]|nr:AAA family ATPase [Sulfuricurvum sp.]